MKHVWIVVAFVGAWGCGEATKEGAPSSGVATPTKSASAKAEAKPADGPKTPTTKLTKTDVEPLLEKTFGIDRMREPADKRAQEVATKLGAAAKTEGDDSFWYYVGDPNQTCYELKLGMKDGAYTTGKASDKASCGL